MYPEIQKFILSVRRHNPEARTWRNYACDLKLFAKTIGDTPLGEVTTVARSAPHLVYWGRFKRGTNPV